jgi:hypothetical protein
MSQVSRQKMKRDALLKESELTGNLVLKTRDPVKRNEMYEITFEITSTS